MAVLTCFVCFLERGKGVSHFLLFFHLNVNSSLISKKGEKDCSFFLFVHVCDNDIFHMFKGTFSYSTHLEKFSIITFQVYQE